MEEKKMENKNTEAAGAAEAVVYGVAGIDGVAVPSKALEKATEDYPIVLVLNEDFIPVKAGDEIKAPYDAVLPMEEIQVVGPMIRVIINVEPMTNVEAG